MNRLARMVLVLCAALLLAAPPLPSRAAAVRSGPAAESQEPGTLIRYVNGLGGTVKASSVEGSNAFLIQGDHLTVLDISDPAAARLVLRVPLPMICSGVEAANSVVYLLCSDPALTMLIYDARDPAALRLVGQLPFSETVFRARVHVMGGALWLATTNSIRRFDLSDPVAPVLTTTFPCTLCSVQASGSFAYLLDSEREVRVWDLSDPRTPLLRSQIIPLASTDGAVTYTSAALAGNTLFVAATLLHLDGRILNYVVTLDVSDPARPTKRGTGPLPFQTYDMRAAGEHLAVLFGNELQLYTMADAANPAPVLAQRLPVAFYHVVGTMLYTANGNTWSIFELGGTAGAALRGVFPTPMPRVVDVTLEGQRLYAHLPDAIQIIDASDPRNPVLQARIPKDGGQPPDIDGGRLLVPGAGGLWLIDTSDPLDPAVRAFFPQGHMGQLHGNLAYVITGTGLEILDVSDPASPLLLGSAAFPTASSFAYGMLVSGGRAYIDLAEPGSCPPCAFSYHTVQVVDVSNPQQPRAGGRINLVGRGAARVTPDTWAASGTTLFVAIGDLHVIDVSDIDNPTISDYRYGQNALGIQVAGGRAYVVDGLGLSVLDLADPLHPTTLGRSNVGGSLVRVSGERAYLIGAGGGLRVLDIREPANPLPLAGYGFHTAAIAVGEPFIYQALDDGGLRIVEMHGVWFVNDDAGGANTGNSWANAFTSLQSALAAASSDQEIWVASGTYKPSPAGDRSASFMLKQGVTVYGGFVGTETALEQRDWTTNVATLSGDLSGDDGGLGNNSENSFHVVAATEDGALDGFTITGGNADGSSNNGGGILIDGASPALRNLIISGNAASNKGGGVYSNSGNPDLSNVTLSGNTADRGGGVADEGGRPVLTNAVISGNSATTSGGGLWSNAGSPALTNVTISGNAAGVGGGIFNGGGTPLIRNSIIWGNTAGDRPSAIGSEGGSATVSFSIVEGGHSGTGNLDTDPLFVSAVPGAPSTAGDLRLQATSPAVDAGDNTIPTLPTRDRDHNPRRRDMPAVADSGSGTTPIVDMGAYERQHSRYTVYLPLASRSG